MSIEELAKITPVNPPTVNKNTNPRAHKREGELFKGVP
jgi:hypothetical protein